MARSSDLPQIPNIPASNGDPTINGIISVLKPVRETLEIYQGNKGNSLGLDRVVRFNDIAILDPTQFSETRASYARIVRVSGNIVRTGKIESTDSATYFDLDNDKIVFNGKINYSSKMPGIFLGKDDDNTYKFNIGYDDKGSLKFDGVNTYLGLWSITPNGIGDNLTENSSKIFLDKTNTRIRVGASDEYINIDGANLEIETSNYVSGVAGAGFHLDPDLLEVGNIAARGIIRTAVFQKDVVSAVGGNLMVRPSDVLKYDMVAEDVGGVESLLFEDAETMLLEDGGEALGETGSTGYITIDGNETFAVDDILRIKDGLDDEWMTVTDISNAPTYSVTRDSGGDYGVDDNPTWARGATVVNYGQSGDGGVYMTASESNAPYLSIWTHAGSPWDTITTHLRLGNLNGFLGYSSDLYGIAIGSTNKYLKYDPTNDLRIQGNITVTGDNGFVKIYDAVPTERVRLGNLNGFLGYSSDLYGIGIGETNKSLTYDPTNGLVITGPGITAGALESSDWAAAAGVKLDLTNKYLKMGGSNVDGAGSAAGVFFGLDTLYKMYVGDGSNQYVQFDGVNLTVHGTGSLQSADWAAAAGTRIDFPNKYLKFGGSDVDASGSAAGIFLGLDTSYKFYVGDGSTKYFKFDGTDVSLNNGVLTAGTVSSSDWAAAAGVRLDLTNKYLKMGGSNVTAAGAAAGIFLGLDTSYKFYIGDGSNEYVKYDGSNVSISTAKADGITLKVGSDLKLEGDDSNPGLVKFSGSSSNIELGLNAAGSTFNFLPTNDTYCTLQIGDTDNRFNIVRLWGQTLASLRTLHDTWGDAWIGCNNESTMNRIALNINDGTNERQILFSNQWSSDTPTFFPYNDSKIYLGTSSYCWLNIYADAGVTSCSDRKWKKNVKQSPLGLDFINKLDFIEWEFDSKTGKTRKGKFHGMLAQDVLSTLEEMGYTNEDFAGVNVESTEDGTGENWGLVYEQFIAPIGRAIQELDAKIEAMRN